MDNLELTLLGGFGLRQNGLPLPELKTQKGQALLSYLAVTRKPAARAAWPACSGPTCRKPTPI